MHTAGINGLPLGGERRERDGEAALQAPGAELPSRPAAESELQQARSTLVSFARTAGQFAVDDVLALIPREARNLRCALELLRDPQHGDAAVPGLTAGEQDFLAWVRCPGQGAAFLLYPAPHSSRTSRFAVAIDEVRQTYEFRRPLANRRGKELPFDHPFAPTLKAHELIDLAVSFAKTMMFAKSCGHTSPPIVDRSRRRPNRAQETESVIDHNWRYHHSEFFCEVGEAHVCPFQEIWKLRRGETLPLITSPERLIVRTADGFEFRRAGGNLNELCELTVRVLRDRLVFERRPAVYIGAWCMTGYEDLVLSTRSAPVPHGQAADAAVRDASGPAPVHERPASLFRAELLSPAACQALDILLELSRLNGPAAARSGSRGEGWLGAATAPAFAALAGSAAGQWEQVIAGAEQALGGRREKLDRESGLVRRERESRSTQEAAAEARIGGVIDAAVREYEDQTAARIRGLQQESAEAAAAEAGQGAHGDD